MIELHPPIEPYDHGLLKVGDGHQVYGETCGNPDGKPAVVLHGGPGRSRPHAADPATSLRHNTTDHLVADLERLRQHLGIERRLVTGGSWGTTLALVYAERFPHRVTEIVVSAIGTTRRSEIDWLYRGAGRFFPEAWQRFRDFAGEDDVVAGVGAGRGVARHRASEVERGWKLAALDRFAGT